MISIQSNYNSLVAQHHLTINTNNLSKATAKLSTGQKITCSADDAAGYFVANSLHYQLTSLEAIHETTAIAMNFTSTAEGALQDTYNNLLRCKDLATQAANSTMSDDAREAVKSEMDTLIAQSEQNVSGANFNGVNTLSYVGISKEVLLADTRNYEVAKIKDNKIVNDGSKTIILATPDDFRYFCNTVSESEGKSFILATDLDMSELSWFGGIGTHANRFKGTFDGNGHVISNFTYSSTINQTGFFNATDGATIKNLGVTNVNITGGRETGGIVGNGNNTNIDNCYVTGCISSMSGGAGGLVGWATNVTITNSYAKCKVDGPGYIGGLVGDGTGEITNCYTLKSDTETADTYSMVGTGGNIGGLVGSFTGNITNCYSTCGVVSTKGSRIGGLCGGIAGNVTNCYAIGKVSGVGATGGLIGESSTDSTVTNCYANTNIDCTNLSSGKHAAFGGLIGLTQNTIIDSCYATGNIKVTSDDFNYVGGLVGLNYAEIKNSYASCDIQDDTTRTGLFIGENYNKSISDNFYDELCSITRTSGDISHNSIGKDISREISEANVTKANGKTQKDLFANTWGSVWDWSGDNPTLKMSGIKDEIEFHIDTGTDDESDVSYNKNVSLDFNKDHYSVATVEDAQKTIAKLEEQLNIITSKLAEIGTTQNRMNSIYDTQMTTIENTSAAKSTIIDTDVAQTTSDMVKSNILQKISSSVLTSANQMNANIAKKLLGIN